MLKGGVVVIEKVPKAIFGHSSHGCLHALCSLQV